MAYFWFFLWLAFAVLVIGSFILSMGEVHRQKRAWRSFAKKYKLAYEPNKLMENPTMTGEIDGFFLKMFTEKDVENKKSNIPSYVTVIEMEFANKSPCDGVIVTQHYMNVFDEMTFLENVSINKNDFSRKFFAKAENAEAFQAFIETPSHREALNKCMELLKGPKLMLFDGKTVTLGVRTHNPFNDPKMLNRFYARIKEIVRGMEA